MKKLSPTGYILVGIPIIFLVGSFFHFVYDLTGQNFLVGLVAPVNESVWEHTKMVLLPTILYWSVYPHKIDKNKWYTGLLSALLSSITTMLFVFYFYTSAFGIESLIIDILILLLSVTIGQLFGLHIYTYAKGIKGAAVIIMAIVLIYAFWTLFPPNIPLFTSPI